MPEIMTAEKARIAISVLIGKALDASSFIDRDEFDKILTYGPHQGLQLKPKTRPAWSPGCTTHDVLDMFCLAA